MTSPTGLRAWRRLTHRASLGLLLALALASGLTASCNRASRGRVGVAFRVRSPVVGHDGALDDRPLHAVDRLVTWVERVDGEKLDGSERSLRYPTTSLALPPLPFGSDLVLRVDAYAGNALLARGRSFPFDVASSGAAVAPDLFLGSLGRFGRRLDVMLSADGAGILPAPDGALLVTVDGKVHHFRPFATDVLVQSSVALGASPVAFPVGARLLGAFDATTKSLALLTPDGALAATLTSPILARHGAGVMVLADPDGARVLLVGGLDDGGSESATAVTRIDVPPDPATSTVTMLTSLPASRWSGTLTWVPGSTATSARALVLGGQSHGPSSDALVIDPSASGSATAVPMPGVDVTGASATSLGENEVLLVGGAATNDVRRLVVTSEPSPTITLASPSPPPLAVRRSAPTLVRFADRVVLVLGGTSSGTLVPSAELVDVRAFPGSTVQTGVLPSTAGRSIAVVLPDASVWVLDRGGVFGYVPPRGQ